MKLKHVLLGLALVLTMFSTAGCRLVFEPDVDAVSRLFHSMPTGDKRVVREFCSGDEVCKQLSTLANIISSGWYASKEGFFDIEEVEVAEDTGYSYVHVKLRIPGNAQLKETRLPLVFEMERVKLRWHIYRVEGIEDYLRKVEQARGIL